jgi:hypothetical protein
MSEKALAGYVVTKRPVRNSGGRKFTLKLTPIMESVGPARTITLRRTDDTAELAQEARLARAQKLMDEVMSGEAQSRKSKRNPAGKRK